MQAVILAGGEGRRLRPYTSVLPKPLLPVHDRPVLEMIVNQLRDVGITRLTFAVGYLAGLLQAYFGDGTRLGVDIRYSMEDRPLGTAGPLTLIDRPDNHFIVMNGDVLTDLDFAAFRRAHLASGAIATLATFRKEVQISLGVLELDERAKVTGYIEKPTMHYPVSTGIYYFDPRVLGYIPENERFDLPDLIRRLVAAGEAVETFPIEGRWLDIGRPEDYEAALALFGVDD